MRIIDDSIKLLLETAAEIRSPGNFPSHLKEYYADAMAVIMAAEGPVDIELHWQSGRVSGPNFSAHTPAGKEITQRVYEQTGRAYVTNPVVSDSLLIAAYVQGRSLSIDGRPISSMQISTAVANDGTIGELLHRYADGRQSVHVQLGPIVAPSARTQAVRAAPSVV